MTNQLQPLVEQFDGGTSYGLNLTGFNCNCAVGAMQVHLETGGAQNPTASQFRGHVRNADGTPDTRGGTNPSQIVATARSTYGVILDQKMDPFETAWAKAQDANTGVSFSISYAPVSGTPLDASPGFRTNHEVFMRGGLVYDPLADGRRPGIPKGPQRWPKNLLRDACGRLNVSDNPNGYTALGQGRALVVYGHAPAAQPTKRSILFEPGNFFLYDPHGGVWVRVAKAWTHKTSAPCAAPITVPWGLTRKRLVMITAGGIANHYVEPGATHVKLVEGK